MQKKCHEFVCRHVSFHSAWRSNLCLGAGKYDSTHFLSVMANTRGRIGQGSIGVRAPAYPIHSLHANEQISYRQKPFLWQRQKATDCSISELSMKKRQRIDLRPTKSGKIEALGATKKLRALLSDNFSAEPKPIRAEFASTRILLQHAVYMVRWRVCVLRVKNMGDN